MDVFDNRTVVDFQKFTFSGHLRQHVYKVLDENIKLGHADYSCYWTLELLCSGLVHSMWQSLFESTAKHINRAAPNAFLYLVKMYEKFAPYEGQYTIMNMTAMRNNSDVRNLVCEVAASLAMCRKNKLMSLPKIKPEHDFLQITITENLKSPSANYAKPLVKEHDPVELYISYNELVYCMRPETRDVNKALYWVAWMLKYASQFKKQNKQDLPCTYRMNPFIDDKHCTHVIWMIWDAVKEAARTSPQSGTLAPYIDSLFKFHCLRWSPSIMKQRTCFLITAILFICESTTLDIHYSVPHDIVQVHGLIENIPSWISAIIQTQKTFSS
jgi:hypothetical protein